MMLCCFVSVSEVLLQTVPLFIRDGSWISVKLESVPIELFFFKSDPS